MSRPKKHVNRKNDILDIAETLFAQKGFEKTTIDEIAKIAGISKGSVYLDFENKDDIQYALIKRRAKDLLEKSENYIKNAKGPYVKDFKTIIKQQVLDVFDMATSSIHKHISLMHTNYNVKIKFKHIRKKHVLNLSYLLEKAAENNEIKQFKNYEEIAHIISVCLLGFFPPYDLKYAPSYRTDLKIEEIREVLAKDIDMTVDIILSGLKR